MKGLIILFVITTVILLFFPVFRGMGLFSGDLCDSYMPILYFLGESIRNNNFPLISDAIGLGFPVYKDIQSPFYYPINWLLALPTDFVSTVQFIIILNVLIYIFGFYLLLSVFIDNKTMLLPLLILVSFNGFIISHIPHYTLLSSIAMLPYYLFFFIRFLKKSTKRDFFLAVLFLILAFTGGHPQMPILIVVLSLMILPLFTDLRKKYIHAVTIPVFAIIMISFIILPTAVISLKSYRLGGDIPINLFPLKYMILMLFPGLFGGAGIFETHIYNGILNINEVYFYPSLLFYFMIIYLSRKILINREYKYLKKFILPLIFLVISYLPSLFLNVFVTPIRAIGLSLILFIVLNFIDFIENYKSSDIITSIGIFILLTIIIALKIKSVNYWILPAIFVCIYAIFLLIYQKRNTMLFSIILSIILLADIFLASNGILKFTERDNIENKNLAIDRESYVVTYLPDEILFYNDYLKNYFKTENLELLNSFSTFGNRGVYYNCHSYNINGGFAFKKYIEQLNDKNIINGGFSNLSFIFNPGKMKSDYVIIPDVPVMFKVKGSIIFPFLENYKDTLLIFYIGNLEVDEVKSNIREDFFRKMPEIKCGSIFVNGPYEFKGNASVFMVKKMRTEQVIHFPFVFDRMNFTRKNNNPYVLFKRESYTTENICDVYSNPDDGSLIYGKKRHYIPMDMIFGFILSVIGLIMMIIYCLKFIKTKC